MHRNLELIWKKIDGELNSSERELFDRLMKEDESFRAAYNVHFKLENSIRNNAIEKAPADLLAGVMKTIKKESALSKSYAYFPEFKRIGFLFGATMILPVAVFFLYSNNISSESSYSGTISEYLSKLFSGMSLPEGLLQYMPYSLAIVACLGLVWIDNFYKQMHKKLRTS